MIREFDSADFSQIASLYSSVSLNREHLQKIGYQYEAQRRGFLLGGFTPEQLLGLLTTAHLALVSDTDSQIKGYAVADNRDQMVDDEYKTWFDRGLKDVYYSNPHTMTLYQLAVDPHCSGQGVASDLVRAVEQRLRAQAIEHFFSIVTMGPLTNTASLLFHTKLGFQRLAMSRPRPMFGLDNYASLMMYKHLA